MGFNLKEHLIGGKTFCCCLPNRMGVIVMSFLTMIVSLLLAIIIWFEVSTSNTIYTYERTAFIAAGIVESLLCITSALGFAGAIARKLVFVRIYAYFLYFHFLLNIAIASYFLWMIHHAAHTDVIEACQRVANAETKNQCTGLLKVAKNVYLGIAAALLLIELYGAIIVTRYMRQLKYEKVRDRSVRESHISMLHQQRLSRHAAMASGTENVALLNASSKPTPAADVNDFNPYENLGYRDVPDSTGLQEVQMPQADVENGYGGGSWRFSQIQAEEKEHQAEHPSLPPAGLPVVHESDTTAATLIPHPNSTAATDNLMTTTSPAHISRPSSVTSRDPPPYLSTDPAPTSHGRGDKL